MNRKLKKVAKSDKFKQEFWHGFEFLSEHTAETIRYGAIGLAVIALGAGIYFYVRHQASVREEALAQALRVDDATVGPDVRPELKQNLHFDTQEQKDRERTKVLADLAAKYHGTQEGAIAAFFLASDVVDKGDLPDAEKRYKDLMDSAPKAYASMARLSLAQVYRSEGKNAEAERLLRAAIADPTVTVSKGAATIELARLFAQTNPAEAKKLLEALRTERPAVSREAVQILGEISQNAK